MSTMSKDTSDLNKDDNLSQRKSKTTKDEEDYVEVLHLLKSSLLAEQHCDSYDNNLQKENFRDYTSETEINISKVASLLASMNSTNSTVPKDIVLYTLLLSGEQSEDENWTSPQTQCLVKQLQKHILERSCCHDITDLLLLYKINYFLTELKPKLLSSTWKKYPAAVVCFMWILLQFKYPYLGDDIGNILPTCLLLVDDHSNNNKIKGLRCLTHLTKNVLNDVHSFLTAARTKAFVRLLCAMLLVEQPSKDEICDLLFILQGSRTDLIQYGRADVIYKAVEHMIYFREAEIIPHLGRFLVEFLSKTEHSLTTNTLLWTRFDDVLNIWLPSMEMEQSLMLREAYIESLKDLLQAMGIASVRWSVKLLALLSEYAEQDHTCDKSLLCLLIFIKSTWPKISSNARSICFVLLKVTIRIYKESATKKPSQNTQQLLKDCFYYLKKTSDEECDRLINELKKDSEINQFCKYIL